MVLNYSETVIAYTKPEQDCTCEDSIIKGNGMGFVAHKAFPKDLLDPGGGKTYSSSVV